MALRITRPGLKAIAVGDVPGDQQGSEDEPANLENAAMAGAAIDAKRRRPKFRSVARAGDDTAPPTLVGAAVRRHLDDDTLEDTRQLICAHVARVEVRPEELAIMCRSGADEPRSRDHQQNRCSSSCRLRIIHDPVGPKRAITLSRKNWHSAAKRAVV
jgi:hypothetical protein